MRAFLRNISYGSLFAISMVIILCGCNSTYEDNADQRDTIESFLESSHSPTLIPESDISSSLEDNPNFYYEFGSYAYLYIEDFYNSERDYMPQIVKGNTVTITFSLYPFTGSSISSSTLPTYSNDPSFEEDYIDDGLNTTYWSFEPLELTVGKSSILESVQEALLYCREGDSIEIYMTRNMGYGDNVIGLIDEDSAIALFCTIDSVIN